MSEYVKTNWQTGDIITADKLNNIQNGIANISGGGVRIIELNELEPLSEDPPTFKYDIGLGQKDFAGSCVHYSSERPSAEKLTPLHSPITCPAPSTAKAGSYILDYTDPYYEGDQVKFYYWPETGVLELDTSN